MKKESIFKSETKNKKKPGNGRSPIIYMLLFLILPGTIISWQQYKITELKKDILENNSSTISSECPSHMIQVRQKSYKYTKPLMLTDVYCESEEFKNVKNNIQKIIDEDKKSGNLISASVYMRDLNNGGWMGMNNNEEFTAGNMMKVPILMAFLKDEEATSGLMNKEYFFNLKSEVFENKKYKVSEILQGMMKEEGNSITEFLFANINKITLKNLFTDIGIPAPEKNYFSYKISSSDYSKFMRMLYSSTYINAENSEYVLRLLSKNNFKNGIKNAVRNDVVVSHQEGGFNESSLSQVHESSIIYVNNNPILLTIMTEGKTAIDLNAVVAEVSKTIYKNISFSSNEL